VQWALDDIGHELAGLVFGDGVATNLVVEMRVYPPSPRLSSENALMIGSTAGDVGVERHLAFALALASVVGSAACADAAANRTMNTAISLFMVIPSLEHRAAACRKENLGKTIAFDHMYLNADQ